MSEHRRSQFPISAWAIRNPVPVALLFLGLVIAGLIAYAGLAIKQFPNIQFPVVAVTVTQSGAAPGEMETQITRPVEDAISGITGVDNIQSVVTQGVSTTSIQFEMGQDLQKKTDEVRAKISQARQVLPRDVDEPQVTQVEIDSAFPIITYAVEAPAMSDEQLSWFVDDRIARELQSAKGVAQVTRVGGVAREINVILDPDRLAARGLTAAQVNNALASFQQDAPGGRVEVGGREQTVRVLGSVTTIEQLRAMTIPTGGGGYVRLTDVADIGNGAAEPRGFARLNGRPVVGFQVSKTKESSDVQVEDAVKAKLAAMEKANPGVRFTKIYASVDETRANFRATTHVLLEGMLLAALVVFLFLRDWRATAITVVAMPVSLIPTFFVMKLAGFSLNLVTLLALTLVIGILVDDAIVEIENIEKRVARGLRPFQAALEGADAIGLAVVATTMAIVVVFTPVSFMPGIPGQFFKEFGLTVSVAVLFSLLVARLVTPLLAAYPRLEHIGVRGGNGLRFNSLRHENLKFLIVETGGLPKEVVADISSAHLPALHHLERTLFSGGGRRANPDPAVRMHSAGGRRAEVELAGAAVLDLLGAGTPAGEIAVIAREPARYGTLFEQVFAAYGIPFSAEPRVRLGRTALGRGILAMLRCAGAAQPAGADDLLAYLRTPGRLTQPGLADRLEFALRREGVRSFEDARAAWDEEKVPLTEIDELRAAGQGRALLDRLEPIVERLFAGPYTRMAHVFGADELDDARVFTAVRSALAELRALEASRLDLTRVHDLLEAVEVRLGEDPQPDRVHVTDPGQVRARRFRAVLILGLQEGEFPRPGRPEPFLPDDERRDLARATGFELPAREDELDRERYLFYVCASRAEERLILSWRTSDEQGGPEPESFFIEDVRDVLALPSAPHATRGLAQVTWKLQDAPTRVEWERAAAAALPAEPAPVPDGLRADEVLGELAARESWSASALEAAADCPVKWLVKRLLDPEALEPDAEQLVRGRFAHEVLRTVFERLAPDPLTDANLPDAERHLIDSIRELQERFPISPNKSRVRAAVRKLEFDLLRYLQHEATRNDTFRPTEFESPFDVDIGGLSLRGFIDRVDTCGEWVLVRDYKTGSSAYPVARWKQDRRLQVAVYLLALEAKRSDAKLAGGVYQALASKDLRPRGLLNSQAASVLGDGWVGNDVLEPAELEEVLADARQTVEEVVARLRSGDVRPCPTTCAYRGGCSYPAICRSES